MKEELIDKVKELRDEFNIMEKTRIRPYVYRRFYFTNFIYQNRHQLGLNTLKEVANVVGYRSHDNVIYAVKQHETLMEDSVYMMFASSVSDRLRQIIPDSVEMKELKTLEEKVMACDNYWEMVRLQTVIKSMNPKKWNLSKGK